jgi:N-glycosylase/DNA lyase
MTLGNYIQENKERANKHLLRTFFYDDLEDGDIFYHLCFCVLVPAGKADKARKVVYTLMEWNYYDNMVGMGDLQKLLKPNIRFHNQKVERLMALHQKMYVIDTIREFIEMQMPVVAVRDYLVEHISGLGYKASSHFMRNIGFQKVAIIDTHILKYISQFMPKDKQNIMPTTKKNYTLLENYFQAWAEELGVTPVCLDWLLWCKEGGYAIEEFSM